MRRQLPDSNAGAQLIFALECGGPVPRALRALAMRWLVAARVLVVLLGVAISGSTMTTLATRPAATTTSPSADDPSCVAWKARTTEAVLAFHRRFAAPNGAFYAYATATGNVGSADYWYTPHALHVLLASVELGLTDARATVTFVQLFMGFHDAEGWVTPYIDDQMWIIEELVNAVALVQQHDVALALRIRDKAIELGNNIYAAWDTSCCGPRPGGVWWNYGHSYKATASNAGCAIALVSLYDLTGDAKWLVRAKLVYDYWTREQVEATGQVLDGINSDGVKDRRVFTYNEGVCGCCCSSAALLTLRVRRHVHHGQHCALAHHTRGVVLAAGRGSSGVSRSQRDVRGWCFARSGDRQHPSDQF